MVTVLMRRISRRLIYVGVLLSIIPLNIIMFCACAIFAHAVVGWFPNADISLMQVFGVSLFAFLFLQSWLWRRYGPPGKQKKYKLGISEHGVRVELSPTESTFVPWNEIRRVKHSRILKTVTIHSPLLRDPYRIALEMNLDDTFRSASELIKKSVGDRWREHLL
jgi:hypothetical protein